MMHSKASTTVEKACRENTSFHIGGIEVRPVEHFPSLPVISVSLISTISAEYAYARLVYVKDYTILLGSFGLCNDLHKKTRQIILISPVDSKILKLILDAHSLH